MAMFLGSRLLWPPPTESLCHGTPRDGSIEHAWRLPSSGPNFSAYSWLGPWLGRNYVHSRVYRVLLAAYGELKKVRPDVFWIYGETGLRKGGRFRPHLTHRNGLSVDLMVPVLDEKGRSLPFPARPWNKFGYDIEFDEEGKYKNLRIDFEAMAEHLYQLQRAAEREGIGIRVVVFDAALRKHLVSTRRWAYLARKVRFSKHPPRVRHDEHYHIDFELPCASKSTELKRVNKVFSW